MTVAPRSRRPAQVNLLIALLLVVLIAIFASHINSTPPPQIAEFNPSEQQIKEPPKDQAPAFGGGGDNGQGAASPSPLAGLEGPLNLVTPNRVRRCVAARQTEDPQSPPCVNYFGGDNGGKTWPHGVTADTIRIAIPDDPLSQEDLDLQKYFNARYEFYGRKLQFVGYKPSPPFTQRSGNPQPIASTDYPDPNLQNQDAHTVAGLDVFADVGYVDQTGDRRTFINTLKQLGVMYVESDSTVMTENDYAGLGGYAWNYYPAYDTTMANFSTYICRRLKGNLVKYTEPPLKGVPRKFGLIVGVYPSGDRPDTSLFKQGLAACNLTVGDGAGANFVPESDLVYESGDNNFKNSVAKFKGTSDPVTSIICICRGGLEQDGILHRWMQAANDQNYEPEYVVSHFTGQDNDGFLLFAPPCDPRFGAFCSPQQQRNHIFGVVPMTKWDPYYGTTMPCGYAEREVDPNPPNSPPYSCADVESNVGGAPQYGYQSLLVLASGIQLAGGHLTPQAFQDGLFKAEFQNPQCDGAPLYQGCVGFGPNDHTMVDSYVDIWSSSADHMDDLNLQFTATYCYGELNSPHGIRYRLPRPGEAPGNAWPTSDTQYQFGEPCH